MKKIVFGFVAIFFATTLFAQNEKFTKAMESLVPAVDTSRTKDDLTALANSFERIANVERTQWLPYYYAALANINAGSTFSMDGSFGDKSADIDPLADKAEQLLNKADDLNKNNSEIWVLKKMLASLRMMGNPMVRYMEFGPIASTALETAKKLNAENPRVYMLEGQDLFYTPEQFGGDKAEAKKKFELAKTKFETFKAESSIHPTWGLPTLKYFMSQAK